MDSDRSLRILIWLTALAFWGSDLLEQPPSVWLKATTQVQATARKAEAWLVRGQNKGALPGPVCHPLYWLSLRPDPWVHPMALAITRESAATCDESRKLSIPSATH